MWLIIVIFVGVFGFMFYACYAHRKSKGHKAEQFHENTTVEIIWTVIPAVILIVIAWPTTRVVVAQKNTSAPDLTVKVTGYQKALAAKADDDTKTFTPVELVSRGEKVYAQHCVACHQATGRSVPPASPPPRAHCFC
jgi:heme/copper-type cytochrome/quinol oxidase subunit 2